MRMITNYKGILKTDAVFIFSFAKEEGFGLDTFTLVIPLCMQA